MDTNTDNKGNRSFWGRKVSIWHIIYLVIICLIINIFLLCIVSGRINEEAYHNFSFAATITSIVLAVVSIVYSLQSGLSSQSQLNGIKNIEERIGSELTRFSTLESSIKDAVKEGITPLEASMGNIQQRQDDLQKSQDDFSKNWKELMQVVKLTELPTEAAVEEQSEQNDIPQIFSVILYTCVNSKETGKDIPYDVLARFFGKRSYYCEGVINGLSVFNPEDLKIKTGSKASRQVVEHYDEDKLGKKDWLKQQVLNGKNEKLGADIIAALDEFFIVESGGNEDSV